MRDIIDASSFGSSAKTSAVGPSLMAEEGAAPFSCSAEASEREIAVYLLELLMGARRLAVARRHRFLSYLIGMAVEEARLLTLGRSAAERAPAASANGS